MMSDRITRMRVALHASLVKLGVPPPSSTSHGSWRHVLDQKGMFTYTGLTAAQVEHMQEHHAVYMLKDGRISMSGLSTETCDHLAKAIAAALKARP